MSENYKFVQNVKCEFFPCHKGVKEEEFNCLFCFCPLYREENCGGGFCYLPDGTKDCSNCIIPHKLEGYDHIIDRLKRKE